LGGIVVARPYLLYRYELSVDDERLEPAAQIVALRELQGQFFPSGPKAEADNNFDSVLMRPRTFKMDDDETQVFTWSVGATILARVKVTYDKSKDDLNRKLLVDKESLRYSDFVAIPALGIFAVDDRSGEEYLGGSVGAHRFRAIFRTQEDADATITPAADPKDFERALKRWKITNFSFTIKPVNPHAPSVLAKRLDEELRKRNVKREHGEWQAAEGTGIKPDDDMQAILDLTEAGYGQIAIKGPTAGGQRAEIKKSQFFEDKDKNLKSLEKPKQMRILVETDGLSERKVQKAIASVIIDIYGN
jgi:hypothetical protein